MLSIAVGYGGHAALRKASRCLAVLLALFTLPGAAPVPGPAPAPAPAPGPAPVRLLVLGDSLSAGYGLAHADGFEQQLARALAAAGHPVRIIDGAVSGDTSAGGRARLDWVLGAPDATDAAQAAIVELGANDGLRGADPGQMRANLAAILDTLAARHIPVLLAGMYAPPNMGPDYERAYRAAFDDLGRRPGVIYDPFFLAGVARVPGLNQADGLHPNPDGVRRVVARLLPRVIALLARVRPRTAATEGKS